MGDERIPHPRETMDDITEVATREEVEKTDTIYVTKNTEIRSKTGTAIILGGLAGLVLCLLVVPLLGLMAGIAVVLLCAVISPILFAFTIHDRTQQIRWRRLVNRMSSRQIEGRLFFPNSTEPEDLESLIVLEVR